MCVLIYYVCGKLSYSHSSRGTIYYLLLKLSQVSPLDDTLEQGAVHSWKEMKVYAPTVLATVGEERALRQMKTERASCRVSQI